MTDIKKNLHRLPTIYPTEPLYFITTCTTDHISVLNNDQTASILIDEWTSCRQRHGWAIGCYVIMPDHVHVFVRPERQAKALGQFMQAWKQWTSKRIAAITGRPPSIWESNFFNHVLRSDESYTQKWLYVRNNPVREGLVAKAEDWPYSGHIHFE